MTARMANEETIFAEALAKGSAQERAEFLDKACSGHDELRRQVDALLVAHERGAGILESPPPIPIVPDEQIGSMIGPYKLLEQIGEGGMGAVYMAEQTHPVRRKVALKIIKPGLDTKQVIARFEAERQALALMDHPCIAKVLDAGALEQGTGRPYFVMELVRGIPITEYCDQNQLTPRQRLELFVQVCSAVQHAHQKGIIHRDIKPSNVLVTLSEDRPTPKIIDFGIAKATAGQRLTERTLYTQFRELIGTPLYMSPEQAEMSELMDVDTRSDVYSLGVLLYELLTGTTPFDKDRLARAAYDEVRRIIREEDPPRPSTRLSTLGETLASVSAQRHTDPKKLSQTIRGELDWIVMKALEKDRARRYETAEAFSADIARYLSDQPVTAVPASRWYRARKVLRRHRAGVAASAAMLLLLVAGIIATTWQAIRATRAERRAEGEAINATTEAQKQAVVNQFLHEILTSVDPELLSAEDRVKGRNVTVLEALNEATRKLDAGSLNGRPEIEAALRVAIGQAYLALDELSTAEGHMRAALEIERNLHGEEHLDVAKCLNDLGNVLMHQQRYSEVEPLYREALAMYRRLLGAERPPVAVSLHNLALLLKAQGKYADAELLHREELAIVQKIDGPEHPNTAATLDRLANLLCAQGKLSEAEPLYRQALDKFRKSLGPDHPHIASGLDHLASLLNDQGRFAQAEPLYRESVEMHKRVWGPEHYKVGVSLQNLATNYVDAGRFQEAEPLLREELERVRKKFGEEHLAVATTMGNLAGLLKHQGKLAEAEELSRRALAIKRKVLGSEHAKVAVDLNNLAGILLEQRKLSEAEQLWREAIEIHRNAFPSGHPNTAKMLSGLGLVLCNEGKLDEAERFGREGLEMSRRLLGSEHPDIVASLANFAATLQAQGKMTEAEQLLREALALARSRLGVDHPHVAKTLNRLGSLLFTRGRHEESEQVFREELAILRKLHGEEHPDVAKALQNLANQLQKQDRLAEAESLFREAVTIQRKLPHAQVNLATSLVIFGRALLDQGKPAEAEPLIQEAMEIRQQILPAEHWHCASVQVLLGATLAAKGKFDEAEPKLLTGYKGLKDNAEVPVVNRRESIERLVKLYDAWNKPDEAAKWRGTLEEFDRQHPPASLPATQPTTPATNPG